MENSDLGEVKAEKKRLYTIYYVVYAIIAVAFIVMAGGYFSQRGWGGGELPGAPVGIVDEKASEIVPKEAGQYLGSVDNKEKPIFSADLGGGNSKYYVYLELVNGNFNNREIKVKKGDSVAVNINGGERGFDFKIDEYSLNYEVAAGGTVPFEFEADKRGTFNFYCSKCSGNVSGVLTVD